jgi:CHAD domain-containing protein
MRDLDVYLLDLPALERRLPEGLRTDLQPLQRLLGEQYQAVHAELVRALESERFTSLLRAWRGFLEADAHEPTPAHAATSNGSDPLPKRAEQPIKRVADRRIRTMLKRVRDEGRAITDASPPEELHELRKSCKKLRYLMEFFQSLYDKQRIREQIKQTKLLLDNLGRFQDTAVQAEHLRETAEAAGCGEAGLPPATLLAMGVLIGQLLDEQARARAAFSEVFARFDSPDNAARFAALLESGSSDRRRVA